MKALWLCLIALQVHGQVRASDEVDRAAARAMLISIYRRADVAQACAEHPDSLLSVKIDEQRRFPVNCKTRAAYLAMVDTPAKPQ